jgi:hypothetical protein
VEIIFAVFVQEIFVASVWDIYLHRKTATAKTS